MQAKLSGRGVKQVCNNFSTRYMFMLFLKCLSFAGICWRQNEATQIWWPLNVVGCRSMSVTCLIVMNECVRLCDWCWLCETVESVYIKIL